MSDNGIVLRAAKPEDVEGMLAVKNRLMIPLAEGNAEHGGFLLGSSPDQYRLFIEHAVVRVLEDRRAEMLTGFAIALPDHIVRASDLWERKDAIDWHDLDWHRIEQEKVGYFEQLAMIPERRYRPYAPALALRALTDLFDLGHRHIFTTVVREPLHNLAAVPLLLGIGARLVGRIDEEYPVVGRIVSDIYYLDRSDPESYDPITEHELGIKIGEMMRRISEAPSAR